MLGILRLPPVLDDARHGRLDKFAILATSNFFFFFFESINVRYDCLSTTPGACVYLRPVTALYKTKDK